jgi:hypothetical protein
MMFVDAAGNFDFRRSTGASRYFVLTSVTVADYRAGDALLELRRNLAWEGVDLLDYFRAAEESQAVRDRVFAMLAQQSIRVDSTIIEKSKTAPEFRPDQARFYKNAWYLHLQYVATKVVNQEDELLVVGASIGTRRERSIFQKAVDDVVSQLEPCELVRTAFWAAASEPCLQVADYCSWAIQRKWERNDLRSYELIRSKIDSEFEATRGVEDSFY